MARILRKFAAAQKVLEREEAFLRTATARESLGVNARINRLMELLDAEVRAWLGADFGLVFLSGAALVDVAFKPTKAQMSGLMKHALVSLQTDTYLDLAKATSFVSGDVKRVLRDVSRVRVEAHLLEGLDPGKSKRLLTKELQAIGFRFTDKAGRRWKLDKYAAVVIRTKTAQAYNTGTILRGSEIGTTRYRVFDGVNDDKCRRANGSIVRSDWALENPVAHPNCVRAFGPLPFDTTSPTVDPNIEEPAA